MSTERLDLTFCVTVTCLLIAAPALAYDDGDPRPEPPRELRDYTVSLGPDLKFFPGGEIVGEYKMARRLSFNGIITLGYRTEDDIDALTGRNKEYLTQTYGIGLGATFYPVGDFENGVQLGLWGLQISRHATDPKLDQQFAPLGAGRMLQAYVGYKYTHEVGLSAWLQAGGQVGFVRFEENCGGAAAKGAMCNVEGIAFDWVGHAGIGYTF